MQGRILVGEHDGVYLMKFLGDVRVTLCAAVDGYLDRMFGNNGFRSVLVDLTGTEGIDSTSLGILAKLSIKAKTRLGAVPTLVSTNQDITRILLSMGFSDVFHIVDQPLMAKEQLGELPACESSEDELRDRVIDAHRTLMDLNESNRAAFQDLVAALEQEA